MVNRQNQIRINSTYLNEFYYNYGDKNNNLVDHKINNDSVLILFDEITLNEALIKIYDDIDENRFKQCNQRIKKLIQASKVLNLNSFCMVLEQLINEIQYFSQDWRSNPHMLLTIKQFYEKCIVLKQEISYVTRQNVCLEDCHQILNDLDGIVQIKNNDYFFCC